MCFLSDKLRIFCRSKNLSRTWLTVTTSGRWGLVALGHWSLPRSIPPQLARPLDRIRDGPVSNVAPDRQPARLTGML